MFWLLIRGAKPPALDATGRVAHPSTQSKGGVFPLPLFYFLVGRVPQVALFYLGVLVFSQSRALLTARVFSGSAEGVGAWPLLRRSAHFARFLRPGLFCGMRFFCTPVVSSGASPMTFRDRRVGSFSRPFSNFYFLVSISEWGPSLTPFPISTPWV